MISPRPNPSRPPTSVRAALDGATTDGHGRNAAMTDDTAPRNRDASDAADEQPLDIGPAWHRQAVDASWALAARDAAIDAGDKAMAARFAAEARDAIAAAVDAGATPAELAWELDYPGGAAGAGRAAHRPPDHRAARTRTRPGPRTRVHNITARGRRGGCRGHGSRRRRRDDAARQEQLARWHHDDHAATAEAELDRTGPDDGWAR